jgi:hypothetical protein
MTGRSRGTWDLPSNAPAINRGTISELADMRITEDSQASLHLDQDGLIN